MVKPCPGASSIRSSAPNDPATTLPCPVQCTTNPPSPPNSSLAPPHLVSRFTPISLASHDPLVSASARSGRQSITVASPGSRAATSTQVGDCGCPVKVLTKNASPPSADRLSADMKPPCICDDTVTPNDCMTITPASPRNCSPGARCSLTTAKDGLWRSSTCMGCLLQRGRVVGPHQPDRCRGRLPPRPGPGGSDRRRRAGRGRCSSISRPSSGQVLDGLLVRQGAQLGPPGGHEVQHPGRVRPCILAQRPADRLADEEVRVRQIRFDDRGQQFDVGVGPGIELADDRGPTQPSVGVH